MNFTVATYRDYNQHCLQGNVWSYDSTFLFVGSVATTIGYGNVTPKTREGKLLCIAFCVISIPIFARLVYLTTEVLDDMIQKLLEKAKDSRNG